MNSPYSAAAEQHPHIQLLLPWYLNQSLTDTEQQQVETHLQSCLICYRELHNLRKLAEVVSENPDMTVAAESSFSEIKAKISVRGLHAQKNVGLNRRPPDFGYQSGFRAKLNWRLRSLQKPQHQRKYPLIAASVLLIVGGVVIFSPKTLVQEDYYTLANQPSVALSKDCLQVVFNKSVSEAEMDQILTDIQARRIAGPNSVGAYIVELSPLALDQHQAIALLRKQPLVTLVEPLAAH